MSAKITLGDNPKNFTKTVQIILLDGSTAPLNISYIYRTRTQFAELLDEHIAATEAKAAAAEAEALEVRETNPQNPVKAATFKDRYVAHDKALAEQVLLMADGWDLVEEFNEANLLILEDKYPGALRSIITPYGKAVAEARVKN